MSLPRIPPCSDQLHGGPEEGPVFRFSLPVYLGIVAVLSGAILLMKGISHRSAVFVLLNAVLVFAAYEDMLYRRVRNLVCILVFATGFLFEWDLSSFIRRLILALAVFGVLALIYYLFPGKAPGGGDVKMIAALAFSLGATGFLYGMLGTLAFSVFALVTALLTGYKVMYRTRIPFLPLICSGVFVYILFEGYLP